MLDPFAIKVKQLPVYNMLTGEKTEEMITLNNRVFGMPLRSDILHRVVVWQVRFYRFLSNSRLVGQTSSRNTLCKNTFRSEVIHSFFLEDFHIISYYFILFHIIPYRLAAPTASPSIRKVQVVLVKVRRGNFHFPITHS